MLSVSPVIVKKNSISADHPSQILPDLVVVEEPLEIRLGYGEAGERLQKTLTVTMRTPGNDVELTLGFLFTEGIIRQVNDILSIKHCKDGKDEINENIIRVELAPHIEFKPSLYERNTIQSSSCGLCGKSLISVISIPSDSHKSALIVTDEILYRLSEQLNDAQQVFKHTGGIHGAALFSGDGELLLFREDIGRHNALDKLIGAALVEKRLPLANNIVFMSSRASFELVQKAIVAQAGVLATISAPSSLAVQMAQTHGLALYGFVNGHRYNQYTQY